MQFDVHRTQYYSICTFSHSFLLYHECIYIPCVFISVYDIDNNIHATTETVSILLSQYTNMYLIDDPYLMTASCNISGLVPMLWGEGVS